MFGIVIRPDGLVHQVQHRYTIIGLGPFPAHRFWIAHAGVWSGWFHMPVSGQCPPC